MTLSLCESSCHLSLPSFSRLVYCHRLTIVRSAAQEVQVCGLHLVLQRQGSTRHASPSCFQREVTQSLLKFVSTHSFALVYLLTIAARVVLMLHLEYVYPISRA